MLIMYSSNRPHNNPVTCTVFIPILHLGKWKITDKHFTRLLSKYLLTA